MSDVAVPVRMTDKEFDRKCTSIDLKIGIIADNTDALLPAIRDMFERGPWAERGYASFGAFFAERFADSLARLDAAARRPIVGELADMGLSTRAIAPAFAVSHKTIVKDLHSEVGTGVPPAVDPIRKGVSTKQSLIREFLKPNPVIGVDGKTYATRTRKPQRLSLPKSYERAMWDLEKTIGRLQRLHADDRFVINRESLSESHRGRMTTLSALLSSMDDDLEGRSKCGNCGKRILPNADYSIDCDACRSEVI